MLSTPASGWPSERQPLAHNTICCSAAVQRQSSGWPKARAFASKISEVLQGQHPFPIDAVIQSPSIFPMLTRMPLFRQHCLVPFPQPLKLLKSSTCPELSHHHETYCSRVRAVLLTFWKASSAAWSVRRAHAPSLWRTHTFFCWNYGKTGKFFSLFVTLLMRQSKFVARKVFIILTVEYDYYNISPALRLHEFPCHLSQSVYA